MSLKNLNLTKSDMILLRRYFNRLESLSRQLVRLTEKRNSSLTDRQRKSLDVKRDNLEREATMIAHDIGFKVYFDPDPQGGYIYLIPPEIPDSEISQRYFTEGMSFKYTETEA